MGRHEIQAANAASNGSWIQVDGYRLARPEPVSLHALGLTESGAVLAWVHNPEGIWYNWSRPNPRPITGAELVLRSPSAGTMRVEWLNAWTGKTVRIGAAVTSEGRATLDVPPVARDVAVRLQR